MVEFFYLISCVSIFTVADIWNERNEVEFEINTSIVFKEKVKNTGRGSTYIVILGNKETSVWEVISKVLLISVKFIRFSIGKILRYIFDI